MNLDAKFTKPVRPVKRSRKHADFKIELGFFPFARYISVVGVHTTLVAFAAVSLPQTPHILESNTPNLTLLFYLCGAVALLQGWWGGWVRNWCIEFSLAGSSEEADAAKKAINLRKRNVRILFIYDANAEWCWSGSG